MRRGAGMVLAAALLGAPALAQTAGPEARQDFSWMFAEGKPADIRTIISGSMTPTLQTGDRIAIFTQTRELQRGDVLMFKHPRLVDEVPYVKRLVGLPGDRVRLAAGRLYLNGEEIARTLVREFTYLDPDDWDHAQKVSEYTEQLPGEDNPHTIHEVADDTELDDTREFIVPAGHLFMMGDNRDFSDDSRSPNGYSPALSTAQKDRPVTSATLPDKHEWPSIGFVPVDMVVGRVRTVMLNVNPCDRARAKEAGAECLASSINRRLP